MPPPIRIVKQSGGHISVYSEVGKGTTFKIYLPQIECSPASPAAGDAAELCVRGAGRILVVEDEEAVRKLTTDFLSRLGYQVTPARDGAEALAMVREQGLDPDLVLTDVVMPAMDGKSLVERLRQTRPHQKVIYMSGYTERAIAHTMDLGSETLLVEKPFSLSDLAAEVRKLLSNPVGETPGEDVSRDKKQ